MKPINLLLILITFFVLCVPSFVVLAFGTNPIPLKNSNFNDTSKINTDKKPISTKSEKKELSITVYRTANSKIENVPLEEYVLGVVASEMPASYEPDALKAQAISARTYIVKFLLKNDSWQFPNGSDITDSTIHQVYKNQKQLEELWGGKYLEYYKKIHQAVSETEGMILTYNGEPIDVSFFAISNGYTENSEDYWKTKKPYLRSVPSHWDKTSPNFIDKKTFSSKDFGARLGVNLSNDIKIERTSSNRVSYITVGNKKIKGLKVREALELKSTDFNFKIFEGKVEVTTKGYGHGVGMSQYGANRMAQEGRKFNEILKYYFKEIQIVDVNSINGFDTLLVKKEHS